MRKVIEWTPRHWWVVEDRPGRGYWPLYEGRGLTSTERRHDAERWLEEEEEGADCCDGHQPECPGCSE